MKAFRSCEIDSDAVVKGAYIYEGSLGASDKEFVIESNDGRECKAPHREFIEGAAISYRIKRRNMSARSKGESEWKGCAYPHTGLQRRGAAPRYNEVICESARK
jgi:hypothetical protein